MITDTPKIQKHFKIIILMKELGQKIDYTIQFHVEKILENSNQFIVTESRSVIAIVAGLITKGNKKTFYYNEHVHYANCGDAFISMYIYIHTYI